MKEYLILTTDTPHLRSTTIGMDMPQSGYFVNEAVQKWRLPSYDFAVGLIGSGSVKWFNTPLHALGERWELLGPPQASSDKEWCWWFHRDL